MMMEHNSGDENSNDGLQIVIESPRVKKKPRKELDETDKKIIEAVEKDIEENLEEKAAKANLTAQNVKNLIKEVVTNEHVLALVRHAENPEDNEEPITVYEPKFTRAKTKQLLSNTTVQPEVLPWAKTPKKVSEVQKLFTEELQEDSSDDEFVPNASPNNTSVESQLDTSHVSLNDAEEPNIALRTRSKLSLSGTPLEVIEEAFIPPDITTDMYDMNCDDDVWQEFLKTFSRPLDEVSKAAEDEDHDPEYNILADEEIDEIDKEELRADRAVTVSRKEFNCLMAELFEYADIYESNKLNEKNVNNNLDLDSSANLENNNNIASELENDSDICIKQGQIPILAQQMRQHVQMLAQNYLLCYENPEFGDLAPKLKDMLNEIIAKSDGKTASMYHVRNLKASVKLVEDWENMFAEESQEVEECKKYVEKVISESIDAKQAGTEYIVTFPEHVMKTISNSDAILYPNLLPRIPFRSSRVTRSRYHLFSYGQQNLIALFLEQALPYMKQDPFYLNKYKKINMHHVCYLISRLLMPHVPPLVVARYIQSKKHPNSEENPIKFFYRNKKAPPAVHYVTPLDEQVPPPYKRSPELLPFLWRQYNFPDYKSEKPSTSDLYYVPNYPITNQIIVVSYPLQLCSGNKPVLSNPYKVNLANRTILPKELLPPLPVVRQKRSYVRRAPKLKTDNKARTKKPVRTKLPSTDMLPDMPSLGSTPVKNDNAQNKDDKNISESNSSITSDKTEQNLSFKNVITSCSIQFHVPESVNQVKRNFEAIKEFAIKDNENSVEKDNPDDISELMKASSTVKSVTKKEPSGAEKKRAKMRREFIANLVMATPEDTATKLQKEENFAQTYFDKLQQTLTPAENEKMLDILRNFDEKTGKIEDLVRNVQSILDPSYKELSDEFYLFLNEEQAHRIGQLMKYLEMKDMNRFITKLQVYFKDQPAQLKKVMKCIDDLSEKNDLTMDTIKTTILPMLKGNAALADWFLQIFPNERPPKLLSAGPHDLLDVTKEQARQPDEEIYETVILPDTEDPYGGSNCVCACHNVENSKVTSSLQHCKNCGLKFIQGKMYFQTGKSMQPAVVSFLTNPEVDHSKRLSATQRKRSESSPSKQGASPNKDPHPHDEHRNSNESEDDDGKKKNKKSRKRKTKDPDAASTKSSTKHSKESGSKGEKTKKGSPKRQKKKKNSKKSTETKPGSTPGQVKRLAEEQVIEYSEPPELVQLKVSSDHSGESESEFFESSQDVTNTDSEDSNSSTKLSATEKTEKSKDISWTKEEDKIILQAFRQSKNDEETFREISRVLESRSEVEIKTRFNKLMSLLQQMTK